MKLNRRNVLAGVVTLGIVLIAGATLLLRQQPKAALYPLADVLWVRDAQGNYHRPRSTLSVAYVELLRSRDPSVDTPKYEPFILLNAAVHMPNADALTPFLILGWTPAAELINDGIPTTDGPDSG